MIRLFLSGISLLARIPHNFASPSPILLVNGYFPYPCLHCRGEYSCGWNINLRPNLDRIGATHLGGQIWACHDYYAIWTDVISWGNTRHKERKVIVKDTSLQENVVGNDASGLATEEYGRKTLCGCFLVFLTNCPAILRALQSRRKNNRIKQLDVPLTQESSLPFQGYQYKFLCVFRQRWDGRIPPFRKIT